MEHYGHARMDAKRTALDHLAKAGQGTVRAKFQEQLDFDVTQVIDSIGGRDRGRTGDLIVANDALSQLSYSPTSSDFKFNKGCD